MSTLSARAPGIQATSSALDARALRIRGVTTLEGVRRNLFGCGDREESRRFVERELARQLECDSQRWGFDFATETPLPGAQRFAWQLVPAGAVPSALRRANFAPAPAAVPVDVPISSPEVNKTQKRITDFLKPCKRLAAPSGKKSSPMSASVSTHHHHSCTHIRPPKVARITNHFSRRAS